MPGRNTAFLPQEQFDLIRSKYSRFNEPWLKEEVEELTSMATENVSHEQMAEQLQRTPSSVRMKLKALGLYSPKPMMPRWTDEDDKLVVQMYDQGVSFEDMAQHFNRSPKAIVARLVNLRIKLFENV
ncbi:MAG: Myb-like DNA-binding domain-containing protein [Bacteroidales bacterium]|nr:Myb-like DNA-binding domain-containing protein [Bacteroidales bacterium]